MNNSELEQLLVDSLSDFKLDKVEKFQLKQLAESLAEDQLNFVRNKSFELCRPHVNSGDETAVRALIWLQRVIKSIQPDVEKPVIASSAFFSPGDDCKNKIISLLQQARKEVDICVFTISDNDITRSILDASGRGVKVTIISDNDKANDRGSDIDLMSENGINVLLDDSPYHMHHKFALFDKRILLNGSFNWTRSASQVNEENILVTMDQQLVSTYIKQFELLKTKFNQVNYR